MSHPFAHPDYPDFASKNQALKAGVPWARVAARRDGATRPAPRAHLIGLIAAALSYGGGSSEGDPGRMKEAEELLARYERSVR